MISDEYSSSRFRCSRLGLRCAQIVKQGFLFDAADSARGLGVILIIFTDWIVQVFSSGVAVKTDLVSHLGTGTVMVYFAVRL